MPVAELIKHMVTYCFGNKDRVLIKSTVMCDG